MTEPRTYPPTEADTEAIEVLEAREFISQGSRFMLVDNVSKVLGPLLVLLCAKLYAGGEWGFFKYYESLLLLLTRLSVAGMDRGVVWIYSQRTGDVSFSRVFSRTVNFVALFAVVLALLAGAHWLGWFPAWSGFAHKAPGATGFNIACYLASVPFQATTLLLLQALINKRRLFPLALIRNVVVPLATLGPAALLALTPLRAYGLAVPYLFGSLLGFGMAAVFFFRAYPLTLRNWGRSIGVPRDMVRFSMPLATTDFAMSVAYRMDILLLGRFAGLEAVEVYSVIVMIANTLKSVRQSFDGVMLAALSNARNVLTGHGVRKFNFTTWLVIAVQIPLVFVAVFFGRELLGLMSPAYADGYSSLLISLGFLLAVAPFGFSTQLLMGVGKTVGIPIAQAAFFVSTFGLNMLLIPSFGVQGAAVAMGMSYFVSGGLCMILFRVYQKTWAFQLPYYVSLLRGLGAFSLPALIFIVWRPPLYASGLLFLAGALAYALWFRRGLRKFSRVEPGVPA